MWASRREGIVLAIMTLAYADAGVATCDGKLSSEFSSIPEARMSNETGVGDSTFETEAKYTTDEVPREEM